jgi:hypothetical protein
VLIFHAIAFSNNSPSGFGPPNWKGGKPFGGVAEKNELIEVPIMRSPHEPETGISKERKVTPGNKNKDI